MQKNYPLSRLRKNTGSQIAEFGPALVLIFLVGLFPLLDLIYVGIAYGIGYYYNQMEAREIAIACPSGYPRIQPPFSRQFSDGNFEGVYPELIAKTQDFQNNGLGRFLKFREILTTMTYSTDGNKPGPTNANGWAASKSSVATTISVAPFLPIELGILKEKKHHTGIPGLTSPLTLSYYTQQVQEQQMPVGWWGRLS